MHGIVPMRQRPFVNQVPPDEVAFLYTNFDLQKEQELLRADDGNPRRGACVIYTFVCLPAPSCA